MVLYARSDVMHVAIPVTDGGCGSSHSRPVRNGAPARTWGLNCPQCEAYLRHDLAHDIHENTPIPQKTVVGLWSGSPDGIPETFDEQRLRETGERMRQAEVDQEQRELQKMIAEAVAGNRDLMAQFMALMVQAQPEPAKAVTAVPEPEPPAVPAGEHRNCLDCGRLITRKPGQKGGLPHRCPGCKARARRRAA
jgi:hypothetical protein